MSSLLQHTGQIRNDGKVELFFYLVQKNAQWERYNGPDSYNPCPDSTTFTDPVEVGPDGNPVLYRAWRKPCGMFGCWVCFRYNGKEHVPDLSVPIAVFRLPRGTERLTEVKCAQYWRS